VGGPPIKLANSSSTSTAALTVQAISRLKSSWNRRRNRCTATFTAPSFMPVWLRYWIRFGANPVMCVDVRSNSCCSRLFQNRYADTAQSIAPAQQRCNEAKGLGRWRRSDAAT
jgi:hypothetical protein